MGRDQYRCVTVCKDAIGVRCWNLQLLERFVPAATSTEETTKPPSALLGKSVITSWEETRMERKVGAPSFRTVRGTLRVTASIGTDGRILSRYELISNARTFQIEGENRLAVLGHSTTTR